MGGIFGGGGGGGGGSRAAEAEAAANREAIAEQRRQFEITQQTISPFVEAGVGAIPQVQEGTTAQGLDARLARIFDTDIFKSLVDERGRAVSGQLAASGQRRSGTGLLEAARVPTELGFGLENLLTARSTDLATAGRQAALGLGSIGLQSSQAISNLQSATGRSIGAGIVTDQQAAAQRGQNTLNTAVALGSIFFSDPALKVNTEEIGHICDLKLYQWDWKDEVKGTIINKMSTIGFMADEVKEKYPQFVAEVCGFMAIDLPNLLDHLEAA